MSRLSASITSILENSGFGIFEIKFLKRFIQKFQLILQD